MMPHEGDLVLQEKKGLDCFKGTNLASILKSHSIETLAVCGFLTNVCVESTMRTAYEEYVETSREPTAQQRAAA